MKIKILIKKVLNTLYHTTINECNLYFKTNLNVG